MPWFSYVALCLTLLVAGDVGAVADEKKLSAHEIVQALLGNTVEGRWAETAYRSYFAPDGTSVYQPEGQPPEASKWRVDGEADRYCAHRETSGWSCYDVYRAGDTIIWRDPAAGTRYPSALLQGRQL